MELRNRSWDEWTWEESQSMSLVSPWILGFAIWIHALHALGLGDVQRQLIFRRCCTVRRFCFVAERGESFSIRIMGWSWMVMAWVTFCRFGVWDVFVHLWVWCLWDHFHGFCIWFCQTVSLVDGLVGAQRSWFQKLIGKVEDSHTEVIDGDSNM